MRMRGVWPRRPLTWSIIQGHGVRSSLVHSTISGYAYHHGQTFGIEFSGAYYHVTARGDRREAIYEGDDDREAFFEILRDVIEGFEWRCHAYCQMTNHYHLFIETVHGNLSKRK